MRDVIKQRLSMAPIREIDFVSRSIRYDNIRINKIKSDGNVIYYKNGSSPAYKRRASFPDCNGNGSIDFSAGSFDLLNHGPVLEFLKENLQWPEGDIETVILPATKGWSLKDWNAEVLVDATTWVEGRADGKGWELLMQASRESNDDSSSSFAFAFHYMGHGIIQSGKVAKFSCSFSKG